VEAGLEDYKVVVVNEIDQAMLLTDAVDQAAASMWRRGSGLPMPVDGSRRASSINRLMRFNVARSAASQ
jgi:hypothetical protein